MGNAPHGSYRRVPHIPEILTQLVVRLLDGRGDVLPSISTCKQHDGNGSSYSTLLEVRHDGFDMVYL
jgi:hypothetical protein